MIRTVIIGTAHMHCNEIAMYIKDEKNTQLLGVADLAAEIPEIKCARYTRAWNLKNIHEVYGTKVYDSYTEMLDEVKPDYAYILCENYKKAKVVHECAVRHVNVIIEKPMATSLEMAMRIERDVSEYGIEAYVNWPVVWRPYVNRMKALLEGGVVGEAQRLRYINGHTGPLGKGAVHRGVTESAESMTDEERSLTWWHRSAAGGGAFLDICCYGALYTNWFLGEGAQRVYAFGKNLNTCGDVEDNTAAIVKYADKLSVIEATWTTPNVAIPSGPMAVCREGVILCTGGAESAPDIEVYDIYGKRIDVPEYQHPEHLLNMPANLAHHKLCGTPIHPPVTLAFNLRVMAILDAAIRSGKSSQEEKVFDIQ